MKIITQFSILLLVCLFAFTSCDKQEEEPAIDEYMSAQLDGKTFKASTFVVTRSGNTTSINGTFGPASNPESIGLSIQNAKVGTFVFGENTEDFAVYNSTRDEYLSKSGTLQITAIRGEWIEGNFIFEGHSINDSSKQVTLSGGAFKMKFD